MCSIIGYKGEFNSDIVSMLLFNSRIRGLHAFGYSYYFHNELMTKKFLDYNKFKLSLLNDKPNMFIAHFRYSTSGDYNILENNQPLFEGNISIAFNGVISQDTKDRMEHKYNMKLKSDNDGYVLLNKYNDKEFLDNKSISFAMVGLKDKTLFALRNRNRPLHICKNDGISIIASTKDILNRSGLQDTKELKPIHKYEL